MKKLIFIFGLLIATSALFAKDFKCTFTYQAMKTVGEGKCSEGKEPIVTVDLENNTVTFPDFTFSESKSIPEYTVSDVKITTRADGKVVVEKDSYVVEKDGSKIKGKDLYGIIDGDTLTLDVSVKVGMMPFTLKVKYVSE